MKNQKRALGAILAAAAIACTSVTAFACGHGHGRSYSDYCPVHQPDCAVYCQGDCDCGAYGQWNDGASAPSDGYYYYGGHHSGGHHGCYR